MKKGFLAALGGLFLLAWAPLAAQLHIGPTLQVGTTYSKNFVIEDTSKYYIRNAPGLFAAGGVDFAYQIDTNIRVQLGVQGQYRTFNLVAPEDSLYFENIKQNTIVVSIPLTLNYRVPLSKGSNKYINFMAGHGLDFLTKDDSIIRNLPTSAPVDSGNGFGRHEYQFTTGGAPISTVLLGVGFDLVSAKGNIFNIGLTWGISTRQLFRGSIREWDVLHQDFDPTTTATDPEEFPDHYYEWALRGSNLSLRASYMFNVGKKKEAAEEPKGDDESGKVEKPEKEKKPKKVDEDEGVDEGTPVEEGKKKSKKEKE